VPLAPPPTAPALAAVDPGPAPSWSQHLARFAGPGPEGAPEPAWTLDLGAPVTHALSTDGGAVYAVADGAVVAIGLDGALRWKERVLASGPVAPTPRGPAVGTEPGPVAVLEAERGHLVARFTGGGPVRGQPVALGDGLAWVTVHGLVVGEAGFRVDAALSVGGGASSDGRLLTLSTLEGDVYAMTAEGVRWRSSLPGAGAGAPLMDGERVYVPFAGRDGRGGVVALRAADGVPLWQWSGDFEPASAPALGALLLLPGKDGRVLALDPADGALRWTHQGSAGQGVTPALCGDSAYLGASDGRLTRLDLDDGGAVWTLPLGAAVTGDPVVVGGLVVVGLVDGRVVAVRGRP
jgi:outer membrane protein assembly factor BamB